MYRVFTGRATAHGWRIVLLAIALLGTLAPSALSNPVDPVLSSTGNLGIDRVRVAAQPQVIQTCKAEDARLSGSAILDNKLPGYSGRGYITGFHNDKAAADFTVTVPSDGFYTLFIGYSASDSKINPVFVNGSMEGDRLFPRTYGFDRLEFGRIRLQSGSNTVRIGSHWGEIDIDNIQIAQAPPLLPFNLPASPVTPGASSEARALYAMLLQSFGRESIIGQQDEHGARIDYIASATRGKAPLLLGLDLLNYSGAYNKPNGQIQRAIDWTIKKKGIVTLSWHWFSPFGATDQVWKSFNTNKTKFDASRISDENSPEYAAVIKDLDLIAAQLKILRDAHVAVLWRPLHEAEGRWFWWGASGPDTAKHLYRLMFDRFTRVHQLDNLLWVWTTTDNPDARAWYPGDDVVDIVGADIYAPTGNSGTYLSVFDNLRQLYHARKPIALCETNTLPDPEALWQDGAMWLWSLVWDDYIQRSAFNTVDRIDRIYHAGHSLILEGSGAPSTK